MQYFPLNNEKINIAAGSYNPSPVKAFNNATYAFWERSLFQRASSVILLNNLPDDWEKTGVKDFLYYCLLKYGFVVVFDDAKTGLSFQPCGLHGYSFYYQPVEAIVSNPTLKRTIKLGEDGELIKLTPDYYGIWDILSYHAEKLSEIDTSINMSVINSKLAYILGAKNKQAGEALKKIYDKMNHGEPLIIYDQKLASDPVDKEIPFTFLDFEPEKKYLIDALLRDQQTLINNFDREIGIPSVSYEKKERLISDEVKTGQADTFSRSQVWLECLTRSLEQVNARFNLDITARLTYEQDKNDEQREDNTIRGI